MVTESGITSGRFVRVKGQMGLMISASRLG